MPLPRPAELARRSAELLQAAGRALLPHRCLVCQAPGAAGLDRCAACAADLPWNDPACARCGLPLPVAEPACGACLRRAPPFDGCIATFRYEPPLDRLLPRLKYHGDLAAGALAAALMLQRLQAISAAHPSPRATAATHAIPRAMPAAHAMSAEHAVTQAVSVEHVATQAMSAEHAAMQAVSLQHAAPQALVPVPLHTARLGRRGYNQALELARPLARAFAIPVLPELMHRIRATTAQTELGADARRSNVRGAFAVTAGVAVPAHVVLVDDTMTTGATIAECARALRSAGCTRIDVWVAARAP
jgi:ComF family protein